MKYNQFFYLYPLFGNSPTSLTSRRIFALYGLNDLQCLTISALMLLVEWQPVKKLSGGICYILF